MKSFYFCLTLFIAVSCGCKESGYSSKTKTPPEIITLTFSNCSWFTTTNVTPSTAIGNVYLAIKGKTNAEKITIRTYGDGLVGDFELKLSPDKIFSDTINIGFTRSIPPEYFITDRKYSTILKAYLGNATLDTTLTSMPLHYTK